MPEVQLLVLHCAGQGDTDTIEHLWRQTIDSCLIDQNGEPKYDFSDHSNFFNLIDNASSVINQFFKKICS